MPHTIAIAIFRDDNSFERLSYACEENWRGQKNNQLAQASFLIDEAIGMAHLLPPGIGGLSAQCLTEEEKFEWKFPCRSLFATCLRQRPLRRISVRRPLSSSFYERITSCRVIVEAPHRHHHKGKVYEVRIDLTVPGGEIVINHAPTRLSALKLSEARDSEKELIETHEPSKHAAHADVYVAIRDAFNAAGRRLQDYARRQSGAVKTHKATAQARGSG
jgi:hypothetical protein